jgi:hypothetical protein
MVPIYSFEFIMIYGSHIYLVGDTEFFQRYPMFHWKMPNQTLEQLLFYIIMSNFFMMYSAYLLTYQYNQDTLITGKIKKLMTSQTSNIMWKFSFWILKYIQSIVFIILLYNSYSHLNHFANLMYMLFFVIYTANIRLYRKTSLSIIVFFSYLIFIQYYYSLNYRNMIDDTDKMYTYSWWGFYRCPDFTIKWVEDDLTPTQVFDRCKKDEYYPQWKDDTSIYF